MARRRSEWYERAMQSIDDALSGFGEETMKSRRLVRHALNNFYPFGERSHHPYRMWCKAIRDTLDRLFPRDPREQLSEPATVRVHPAIGVVCTWCKSICLMCSEPRERLLRLQQEHPEDVERWVTWNDLASGNDDDRMILADWLEDVLGFEKEAQQLRTVGTVRIKKPKRGKKR